jgi:hypothetical protein
MAQITQRILHPAWRDELEPVPYPFGDWATLSNAAGVFLQEGTFLDATIYLIGAGPRLRLASADVTQQSIKLWLGDDTNPRLGYGIIDLLGTVDDIALFDTAGRPAGLLISTLDRLAIFQTWPLGTHVFTYAQTGFAADVCLPLSNSAFRGFLLEDGSVVAGDIWLVGDDGIVLSATRDEPVSGCDPTPQVVNRIRVDVVGDPLSRRRLCASANAPFDTPRFLRSITFKRGLESIVCVADAFGDIKLTAGRVGGLSTILRIRNVDGNLQIAAVGEPVQGL